MKSFMIINVFVFCLFISGFFTVSYADELIYDNSNNYGYTFTPGAYEEFFDYGFSYGGEVKKFTFRYYNNSGTTPRITVRFYYSLDKRYYDIGYLNKQIIIYNLPATGWSYRDYTHVLSDEERFELYAGTFGYSIECSSGYTDLGLGFGGLGNENELWIYDSFWGWYPIGIDGAWAGLYMQIYEGPPIDEVTCDIKGYKFDDVNANGVWDGGEATMPGWEIYLDANGNGSYEVSEPNVITDPNGMYFFENLDAPATYRVREVMKDGWTQTVPGAPDNEYLLFTEPNNVYGPYNFGNTEQQFSAVITGRCFFDSNANSEYDPGESGHSNYTVYIDGNENGKYDTGEISVVTNSSGYYIFNGLEVGSYSIGEVMKSGWVQTYPTDACTYTVTIESPDQVIEEVDFGHYSYNDYGGGSGTESDPYLIRYALHLQALGANKWDWDKHYKLASNISLRKYKGEQFNLIGRQNFSDQLIPFSGTFDGDGYYVAGFSYNYTGAFQESVGLFGYVHGDNAEIRNLKMYDTTVETHGNGTDSGALIGMLRSGTVSNCYVGVGLVKTDNFAAGGMIGDCMDGTITDCHAKIDVESPDGAGGGLIGYNWYGILTDCSAEGTVSGYYSVGGFAGQNGGEIRRCYAISDVTGFQHIGGLVGENSSIISECYSQGTVQTVDDKNSSLIGNEAGGIVGRNSGGGVISDCYSGAEVRGGKNIGGLVGLTWSTSGTCYITNSYSVGVISGVSYLGGLIGYNIDSVVTGCVWDRQTSGRSTSSGGIGKTTWQMQNTGTFDYLGWDLSTPTWNSCPAVGYPVLAWQNSSDYPGGVTLKWTAREGGILPDHGEKVLVDFAGNVVVASWGYVEHETETNYDYMVSKYTSSGDHLWTKMYDSNPDGDMNDLLVDMAIDGNGNIYVTGDMSSSGIITVKFSPGGVLLWDRQFNGPDNDSDYAREIAVDALGNVYIAADTRTYASGRDFCLIKYDTDGVFKWAKVIDGGYDDHDYVTGLAIDSVGNIYVTGDPRTTDGTSKILTLKYNPAGVLQWQEYYQSPVDTYVGASDIGIDNSGDIYIAGGFYENNEGDFLLLKYNPAGGLVWPVTFGVPGNDKEFPMLAFDEGGNIYVGGTEISSETGRDYVVAKFSPDGSEQWYRAFDGEDNQHDGVTTITVDSEQNVYLAGVSDYYYEDRQVKGGHVTTLKYDADGNFVWSVDYDSCQGLYEYPTSIAVSQSKEVYVTGSFEGNMPYSDTRILSYAQCSYDGDCDVDFKVNLADFAVMGANWLDIDCDECQKSDWTGDGNVMLDDILVIAENWLQGS